MEKRSWSTGYNFGEVAAGMFRRPYTVDSRLKNAGLSLRHVSWSEQVATTTGSREAQVDKDDHFRLVST